MQAAFDDLRADYDAGTSNRYLPTVKGAHTQGSGADYHYRDETKFFRMLERARNFDRNNMVVGQGVNRLVANVIQDGFTLDVLTPDADANKLLREKWYEWGDDAEACDWEGEKSFVDLEQLVFRNTIVDGDVISLLTDEGSVQTCEAHRLRTPRGTKRNVVHGVLLDERGRRRQYWITKRDIDPLATVKQVQEIQPYNVRDEQGERVVLHNYFPWRLSQTRGVSALVPCVYPVHYHDDLQCAKMVQAQVASCWAIIEEQAAFTPPGTGPQPQTGERTETVLSDGSTRISEGMAPGMRVKLPKGVKAQGFSPNIPNPEFFPHAALILTFIAVNLDLPLHVLLLDPSKTNFSGWRGAIDQARIRFRAMQRQMIRRFHCPVYRWKVRQWISEEKVLAAAFRKHGKAIFEHAWNPPTWSYIEPHKDIQANALELATHQTSPRRQRARQGEDYKDLVPEIVADAGTLLEAAEAKAQELNQRLKPEKPFTREEVLRVFTAKGVSVTATQDAEQLDEPDPAGKESTAA
jgi:lambda family phage portal protein